MYVLCIYVCYLDVKIEVDFKLDDLIHLHNLTEANLRNLYLPL